MKSLFLTLLLIANVAAAAQVNTPSDFVQPADRWAGWVFQEENDVFTQTNVDKYYTQGLRFSMTRNPLKNPKFVESFADWFLPKVGNPSAARVWSVGIGQNLYTPDDITNPLPQLNERHWGAFLYADNMVQLIDKNEEKFRHVFELQTGVIGPAAGGRFAQSTIHQLIGSAKPLGWSNQLKNEPGVNLIYEYDLRRSAKVGPLDVDVQPHAGGSLGTVMTYGSAGAIARLGKNNSGFLNGALRATAFTQFDGNRPPWEIWVYAGAEGRAVGHNIFLSGGTFRQIPTEIETKRFVYDLLGGLSVRYRRWRLTYNLVRRGPEFTHPLAIGNGRQEFGSIVFSVEKILPR